MDQKGLHFFSEQGVFVPFLSTIEVWAKFTQNMYNLGCCSKGIIIPLIGQMRCIKDSPLCDMCKTDIDSNEHMLRKCTVSV